MSDLKRAAFEVIHRNMDQIALIGDSLFSFAEVAMQEFEICRLLSEVLSSVGFDVETGISGFPTAVVGTYGAGHPVIAIHSEFDALPSGSQEPGVTERKEIAPGGPGHAEGHNCGPAVAIGGLYAVKRIMESHGLGGTIKFFGVPAEEVTLPRPPRSGPAAITRLRPRQSSRISRWWAGRAGRRLERPRRHHLSRAPRKDPVPG